MYHIGLVFSQLKCQALRQFFVVFKCARPSIRTVHESDCTCSCSIPSSWFVHVCTMHQAVIGQVRDVHVSAVTNTWVTSSFGMIFRLSHTVCQMALRYTLCPSPCIEWMSWHNHDETSSSSVYIMDSAGACLAWLLSLLITECRVPSYIDQSGFFH